MKNYINRSFIDTSIFYSDRYIGLLLIIVGIIFLLNPKNLNLKVSASLILLGIIVIMIFSIDEKKISKVITGKQLTGLITLWIILAFFITDNIDADLFSIIVILGIFILKEFSSDFMGLLLKKRMTFLYYLLIIVFTIIIGQRIINVIGI